jgi:hypothetical protein
MTVRAMGFEMSQCSIARTGHMMSRFPAGSFRAGRPSSGINSNRSRGSISRSSSAVKVVEEIEKWIGLKIEAIVTILVGDVNTVDKRADS